jgi:hypothetical protein
MRTHTSRRNWLQMPPEVDNLVCTVSAAVQLSQPERQRSWIRRLRPSMAACVMASRMNIFSATCWYPASRFNERIWMRRRYTYPDTPHGLGHQARESAYIRRGSPKPSYPQECLSGSSCLQAIPLVQSRTHVFDSTREGLACSSSCSMFVRLL